MCGICGIVDFNGPPTLDTLHQMISRLGHRGPDGHGYYRDEHAALGHTRLSIIDLSGGAQPMSNTDGTIWVTFNGEIFNYIELADQLRRAGHTFHTVSDTEVIVHAWQEWGVDCFAKFNGQWALALWDHRERRLVLSRDRLGVRPLYYTRTSRSLRFASEVKAIFADPAVPRELDPIGLDQTFTYWSTVAPRTIFSGIWQLEPGHYATVDAQGFQKAPYWHIDFPHRGGERGTNAQENAQLLRDTFVSAVRLRFLRSDVPVGAYLSGGLDSSIIAAVIRRYTDVPLRTFSLRFCDDKLDEGHYQKEISAALGTEHHEIVVSPADIAEVFPQTIWHTETPILRTAPAPLYLLSKLVSDSGYKVVVTGEGADEVFGGYDIFREARVRQFWARDPASAKRTRAVELLYPWMSQSPGRMPAFARTFFARNLDPSDLALSHRPRWDSTAAIKGMLTHELHAQIEATAGARLDMAANTRLDMAAGSELIASMPTNARAWDPLSRAQWLEMTTLLAGYILASQGDRMLMANSVEGRFPFLDRDLVDLAGSLPASHKLLGMEEKYLLKRAFADLVPAEIRHRPKQPYRAPDAESFFGASTPEWLGDLTSPAALRAAGVFKPGPAATLLAKGAQTGGSQMSNTDNMRILAIISTQLLHASFICGNGPETPHNDLPQPTVAVDRITHDRSAA